MLNHIFTGGLFTQCHLPAEKQTLNTSNIQSITQ